LGRDRQNLRTLPWAPGSAPQTSVCGAFRSDHGAPETKAVPCPDFGCVFGARQGGTGTVHSPTPNSVAIARQERPCSRSEAICATSTVTLFLPSAAHRLPLSSFHCEGVLLSAVFELETAPGRAADTEDPRKAKATWQSAPPSDVVSQSKCRQLSIERLPSGPHRTCQHLLCLNASLKPHADRPATIYSFVLIRESTYDRQKTDAYVEENPRQIKSVWHPACKSSVHPVSLVGLRVES
jgi:hypothetical protein